MVLLRSVTGWVLFAVGLAAAVVYWRHSVRVRGGEIVTRRLVAGFRRIGDADVVEVRMHIRPSEWGGSWSTHGVTLHLADGRAVAVQESACWSEDKLDAWYRWLRQEILGDVIPW